jgi:SAM-dependent methyltransferase
VTAGLLTPRRIRGTEHLDDPTLPAEVAIRSLRDVRLCNRLFGGTRAILRQVEPVVRAAARDGRSLSLLDVGTGAGDIPSAVARLAASRSVRLTTTGIEWTAPLARGATGPCDRAVAGDARALPFADGSFDVVTCSQVIHHLDDDAAQVAIAEMHRVARDTVIIGELRRSWFAAAGVWLASWPLAFHPVSRHDGVVSVLRGFEGAELGALVRAATGIDPTVHRSAAFRVSATWSVR